MAMIDILKSSELFGGLEVGHLISGLGLVLLEGGEGIQGSNE